MEGELWAQLYPLIQEEGKRRPRKPRVQFSDTRILEVYFWAVLHDRPTCWACNPKNWPREEQWREFPSPGTMSQRLQTLSVRLLCQAILDALATRGDKGLVCELDSKPLVVGSFSKDRDAKRGHAVDTLARGYKLFSAWDMGVVPIVWTLGPMNRSDPEAGMELVPKLQGYAYVLGDSAHDSNPLHAKANASGSQLVTPRKKPQTGLGHRDHEPGRLRSIELLESPLLLGTGPSPFGKDLYAMRTAIERRYGNLCGFGGGLQPLPSWVRTPHRVALWTAAKLAINGIRQCIKQRLTALAE
jgi:hypothetical protein